MQLCMNKGDSRCMFDAETLFIYHPSEVRVGSTRGWEYSCGNTSL